MQVRSFKCDEEIISCANCMCNYPAPGEEHFHKSGEWCQVFSFLINRENEKECKELAAKCKDWMPREFDRALVEAVGAENPERWYEKDSMG